MKFKPGDRVICISPNVFINDLIKGNTYTIEKSLNPSGLYVTIRESDKVFFARRFKLLIKSPNYICYNPMNKPNILLKKDDKL
jgi:hypothetical protein